jgi:hypothetical protein
VNKFDEVISKIYMLVDGWMDGWMDGRMDFLYHHPFNFNHCILKISFDKWQ